MAAQTLHALDFLAHPEKHRPRAVCVVFGDEAFLRREAVREIRRAVLGGEEGDFSLSGFEGDAAQLADVLSELETVAMFGPGQRLVVVRGADGFVGRYRGELEDYVAEPVGRSVLVLELRSFPANTRLYKAVAAEGLVVDCNCPKPARLVRWLGTWAQQAHQVKLPQAAAEVLLETIGPELGLLDQELAKLAGLTGPESKVTPETISRMAGGWRTRTTWEMIDAALDGDLPAAMTQLDRLVASGENPIGILAQVSATLRRLAAATRLVLQAEAAGRRITLKAALGEAGVKPFVLDKVGRQLRRLGRQRGSRLYRWLLQADLDLKGASALPPRLVLERLIVRLAVPAESMAGAE